ncbi:MAG: glycoside hydrolase [Clostridia bacterium]|nr:glycoside hydrolase [Clostridia bacterium]
MEYRVPFLKDEHFFGCSTVHAMHMPLCAGKPYEVDLRKWGPNQTVPLLVSDKGRYIWSEYPFALFVDGDQLVFDGEEIVVRDGYGSLRGAYLAAMEAHFPFDQTRQEGRRLPREFFRTAQYCSWMECTYHPTQETVLAYAHAILEHGLQPGILIIDEGWHGRYGEWRFDPHKFPDPKAMIEELHALGFTVMLWVCPLVTADGESYVTGSFCQLNPYYDRRFLRNKAGEIAIVPWWNGYSAILDMRNEWDRAFLDDQLQTLMREYGVDGFKFDGGGYGMYLPQSVINGEPADNHDAIALNHAWNDFGQQYRFHEFKDSFKNGGKAMIQRLCDRPHTWDEQGIRLLVPSALIQGLTGHPFVCPDMIGGGSFLYNSRWAERMMPDFKVDEELFVRMAQASALFPMMQFSWAPWNVLSKKSYRLVVDAAMLHVRMADTITALVAEAEQTGEPIVRSLEYVDPHKGYATVMDEFLLGHDLLVAPVLEKGARERDVVFPKGRWQSEDGTVYEGGMVYRVAAPLDKLPWFRRVSIHEGE